MAKVPSSTRQLDILGVRISLFRSYRHAVDMIVERIILGEKTFCIAINPEKIYRAQKDIALRELLNLADLPICDGVGAVLAARLLHRRKIARITGVQLFLHLMQVAEDHKLGVYLLGASAESNAQACLNLLAKHPRLRIVGSGDGYFLDDREMVNQINASDADMLFVAMGSPRQEKWIATHRHEIRAPFCMGIGGTLDVVAGRVAWAPAICRRTGTEFLYRLFKEPRRWRRQSCYPWFVLKVLSSKAAQIAHFPDTPGRRHDEVRRSKRRRAA